MQTFFVSTGPVSRTAEQLDRARLGKQRVEAMQILLVLLQRDTHGVRRIARGWVNHPAAKMWRGHELALAEYTTSMCDEWLRRGYRDTVKSTVNRVMAVAWADNQQIGSSLPAWVEDAEFFSRLCSSHRLALLHKNYEYYRQLGWPEDTLPLAPHKYVWPHEHGFCGTPAAV